jgi:hypothetical protein
MRLSDMAAVRLQIAADAGETRSKNGGGFAAVTRSCSAAVPRDVGGGGGGGEGLEI